MQRFAWHPPFSGDFFHFPFSAAVLKWIAVFTMLLDHIGAAILLFYFRSHEKTAALATLYELLRDLGRIAFPLYIFLLVEGLRHSRSIPKYLLRLGIFSLISEIPFDLAFYDKIFYWQKQNVFFTLLIGLCILWGIDSMEKTLLQSENKTVLSVSGRIYLAFMSVGLILAGCALAYFMHTDYHFVGVLAICAMYLLRRYPLGSGIACCLILMSSSAREVFSLAAMIPISLYNGKRGRQAKYFFYAFYPVHLILLYLCRCLIL